MKKSISILLLIMLAPMMVWADSAGPRLLGDYEAIVINKDGVKTINGKIIPYNTKVYVISGRKMDGYRVCYIDNSDCVDLPSLDGIAVSKEEVFPDDLKKSHYKESKIYTGIKKLLIVDENGIKLFKGPADAYNDYGVSIPYNTFLNSNYCINDYCYIDNNEYKGWINTGYKVAIYNDESYLAFDDLVFPDSENSFVTIPKGSVLKGYYWNDYLYHLIYDNEYLGLSLINNPYSVSKNKVGVKSIYGYILTRRETNFLLNDNVPVKIPMGEKIKILYGIGDISLNSRRKPSSYTSPVCISEDSCYYYIEYNGKRGFVDSNDVVPLIYYLDKDNNILIEKIEKNKLQFKEERELYDFFWDDKVTLDDLSNKYKKESTIPANTDVTSYYTLSKSIYDDDKIYSFKFELIKYNGIDGWVISEIDKHDGSEITNYISEKVSFNDETNNSIENKGLSELTEEDSFNDKTNSSTENKEMAELTEKVDNKANTPEKKDANKSSDTLIYALIGAILVCVTAIITIVLVNGRKEKSNE